MIVIWGSVVSRDIALMAVNFSYPPGPPAPAPLPRLRSRDVPRVVAHDRPNATRGRGRGFTPSAPVLPPGAAQAVGCRDGDVGDGGIRCGCAVETGRDPPAAIPTVTTIMFARDTKERPMKTNAPVTLDPPTVTAALAAATQAEQDAAEAQSRLQEARQRAEDARQRAEAQRAAAMRAYLAKLTQEYPAANAAATKARGEAHARLVEAVRGGVDVHGTYIDYVRAAMAVWEIQDELDSVRYYHGQTTRTTDGTPVFDFASDIGTIIGGVATEAQDDAIARIQARRECFMAEGGQS